MARLARFAAVAAFVGLVLQGRSAAADYSFDLSEVEARPLQFSGWVEGKFEHLDLRPEAATYPLTAAGRGVRQTLDRGTAGLELAATWRQEPLTLYARAQGSAVHDAWQSGNAGRMLEAGLRVSPRTGLALDAGKQVQRWGKGYAWNPVGFFERPKDPSDPQASREGYVMASGEFVATGLGPISSLAFTPLLLPVRGDVNTDYGSPGHANAGARLALLVADTHVDVLWAAPGSRPQRVGLDFSRNLGPQLELHGEWARTRPASWREPDSSGSWVTRRQSADSWLLGLRYLSDDEVTWIAELYRNAAGADDTRLAAWHELLRHAFGAAGTPAEQTLVKALAASGLSRVNPGRRYGYLRVSAKDPFDWLYVNPALTAIVNLDDHSLQLVPELLYSGWSNLELRARLLWLHGRTGSEFGEKPAARRIELALRLYF